MNVLVIGNGFDIQHGLPTSYNDFFKIIKPENGAHKLSIEIETAKRDPRYSGVFKKLFDMHPGLLDKINIDNVRRLENQIQKNIWAQYYSKCQAEINGWIDFENEIHPAINLFQKVFSSEDISFAKDRDGKETIRVLTNDELINRRTELFDRFFGRLPGDGKLEVKAEYSGSKYGVFKSKIIKELRREFDEFISLFRDYLIEVVDKIEINEDPVIKSIKADSIISFNYTNTELKYSHFAGVPRYHVHGSTDIPGSMVMGVNKVQDDPGNTFVYFAKYYQRIRKKPRYIYGTSFSEPDGYGGSKLPNIVMYGHSLDITDEDFLKPLILNSNKVVVFYYDEDDYEKKIVNLITLLTKDVAEKKIYGKEIVFKPTTEVLTKMDFE